LTDRIKNKNKQTDGRWLLRITIPPSYPFKPPQISFATPIVHPNVHLQTGEICLDLLKDKWSPAYSVLQCVREIRMLLGMPGVDSPFNVDVAALLRDGDALGARRLVELWAEEERYEGE
jgi:peroxin-4